MKIQPEPRDFKRWISCVPDRGDLLFFRARDVGNIDLPVPLLTTEELKARAVDVWTLNARSWYGNVIARSDYAAWMPRGVLESLDESIVDRLAVVQSALKVRTLISDRYFGTAKSKVSKSSGLRWLTSQTWAHLSEKDKVDCVRAWSRQSGLGSYPSIAPGALKPVSTELKRIGLAAMVNQYASMSGPNCFAATAAAIAPALQLETADQWLHPESFARFLEDSGYRPIVMRKPEAGDVLIFRRNQVDVHAAYFVGSGCYFEKPGQDFYEPYRLVKLANWRREWPRTTLRILRLDFK